MNANQGLVLALAIVFSGATIAADTEKDTTGKARTKPPAASTQAPAANAGKSNTAGPKDPLADVPLKDRKIVAPDGFSSKDDKIVAQPDKPTPEIPSLDNSKKPILATPAAGSPASTAAPAGK